MPTVETVPPSYRPLRAEIADRVRERVVAGHYRPGERLVERRIAADLGVSRIPVREALQVLVQEGFAIDRDTRGIAVRTYDADEVAELFDIRAALETQLVERLTGRLADADRRALQASLDRARDALARGDVPAAIGANAEFHDTLSERGHGPLARQLVEGIAQRMRWLLRQHADPQSMYDDHVAMLESWEAGDVERARQLVRDHLDHSKAAAQEIFRSSPGDVP